MAISWQLQGLHLLHFAKINLFSIKFLSNVSNTGWLCMKVWLWLYSFFYPLIPWLLKFWIKNTLWYFRLIKLHQESIKNFTIAQLYSSRNSLIVLWLTVPLIRYDVCLFRTMCKTWSAWASKKISEIITETLKGANSTPPPPPDSFRGFFFLTFTATVPLSGMLFEPLTLSGHSLTLR